jgi:hypothetical protein
VADQDFWHPMTVKHGVGPRMSEVSKQELENLNFAAIIGGLLSVVHGK